MALNSVLIIEDEKPNADRLKRLLGTLRPQMEVLTVLESIAESVDWLGRNRMPDLILMDVRLSDGLSFDIFKQVNIAAPVVFTTAYDEYAVQAFKVNSVAYLLKPVEPSELRIAVEKCESLGAPAEDIGENIRELLQYLQPKEYRSRFLLPFRDGYKTLLVSDVAYFYSEMKLTHAKLNSGPVEIIPQTMEELESQLDPRTFFRANRQFILHIDAIQQVHNYFNGKLKVDLRKSPDAEVVISREKAVAFKGWLDY